MGIEKHRTPEQVREHYEIEKELANRLRNAPRQERRYLYSALYDELYQRVPHHPQLTRKLSPEDTAWAVTKQMRLLRRFLSGDTVFLEIGPGDCALSFEVTKYVKRVYAVDVSEEITRRSEHPKNFELILSDGASIPLPENSVNVAFSNHLMEHLHPDDAFEQLQNIHRVLAPGGVYVCTTPNKLNGPHDVSKYFDTVASGFHLKEYTATELSDLFSKVGFSKLTGYVGAEGIYIRFPLLLIRLFESLLGGLPRPIFEALVLALPPNQRLVGMK